MAKNKLDNFNIINLRHLARVSEIDYAKIHNNLSGKYHSLTEQEETRLYNAIHKEVTKATLALGFSYEGKRYKPVS